jgi:hypothetical protein
MELERKALEEVLARTDLHTQADAVAYADALTQMVWNHNLLGLVYEYYDENAVYKCANGRRIASQDEIVKEFLSMQAAFPDLRVHVRESFASGDEKSGFTVYQRSYCEGTNLGTSKFGPPTGNTLNDKNSMGQTVYVFKKVQERWKVCTEFSLRSQPTIDKLLQNPL